MKILVCSPYPEQLFIGLHNPDDEIMVTMGPPASWPDDADWIVCYGYRYLIGKPTIEKYKDRIINIHIAMLPYNRGADPNFWSWFDDTPKGVTIHAVDAGLDTGPILAQAEMKFVDGNTLESSYNSLQKLSALLFATAWPDIRDHKNLPIPQPEEGTYHRSIEKEQWMERLPLGWETPVEEIVKLGKQHREQQAATGVS